MSEAPEAGGESAARAGARVVILALLAAQLAAVPLGFFRSDDWTNLEHAATLGARGWVTLWTALNPYRFYRPLVELWHALWLALAGLRPAPHLLALVAVFALETWLLARLARVRGASRTTGWLVAAAAWTQVNAYSWTTLWPSNATGGLMTGFLLLALLLHHRAVRRSATGDAGSATFLAAPATAAALLCKEEAVLIPVLVAWMEIVRWRRLDGPARRTALVSWLALSAVTAAYVAFRVFVLPSPRFEDPHYGHSFGVNWIRNLAWFGLHLAALPATAAMLTAFLFPAAWRREARRGPAWEEAKDGLLVGLGWAAIGVQIFLPMGGHGYGYLYAPAFGIAWAVGHWVRFAALAQRDARGRAANPALPLAAHGLVAVVAVALALQAIAWPRYGPLAREAFATIDRALPVLPPNAHLVLLDPFEPETFAGRSIINLMFDSAPGSVLRLHYRRPDLTAEFVRGPAVRAAMAHPPQGTAVFLARQGRLTPLVVRDATTAAKRNDPDAAERTATPARAAPAR